MKTAKISVLFVCMGNICRSPMAEGVFRQRVEEAGLGDRVHIDSAGTHAYHVGEPPDPRARETASRRGIELEALRARRVTREDLTLFDYVLAMDQDNLAILQELAEPAQHERIRLFMEFAPEMKVREVPDPYYGGQGGFDQVFDLVEAAADGLLEEIRQRLESREVR